MNDAVEFRLDCLVELQAVCGVGVGLLHCAVDADGSAHLHVVSEEDVLLSSHDPWRLRPILNFIHAEASEHVVGQFWCDAEVQPFRKKEYRPTHLNKLKLYQH